MSWFGIGVAVAGYYGAVVQVLIAQGRTKRSSQWRYLQSDSVPAQYFFAGAIASLSTVILLISVL